MINGKHNFFHNDRYSLSRSSLIIVLIAFVFYYVGELLRPHLMLASFWPVNAVLTGVFIRHRAMFTWRNILLSYITLALLDYYNGLSMAGALLMNIANILFVVVAAFYIYKQEDAGLTLPMMTRLFPGIFLASLCCATAGAPASVHYFGDIFHIAWLAWFSEQLSTGMLIIPVILASGSKFSLREFKNCLPLLALMLSASCAFMVGGGASLTFTLPALIWCAMSYSLLTTVMISSLVGLSQIILVSINLFAVDNSHILSFVDSITVTRVAVAAMAISPVICACKLLGLSERFDKVTVRANFDTLTRLYSRSGLFARLEQFKNKAISAENIMSIILIDLDYFKRINDTYGHLAGDEVLREFSERLRSYMNESNIICRAGGEEFLILTFDETTHDQCYRLAEEIRLKVCSRPFQAANRSLDVTVSIGFATSLMFPEIAETSPLREIIDRLISHADENLYQAKRDGRNKTSPVMA